MNKKIISILLIMLLAMTAMVGCGGSGGDAEPVDSGNGSAGEGLGDPVSLTLGHPYTTTDYRGAAMDFFAQKVSELSDGNITVSVFPSGTLTTSQDALKSVASGSADMAIGALSFSSSEVPALLPLDIGGIYDPAYFDETVEAIMPVMDKIMATQNQKILYMPDETNMIFYLNKDKAREVHSPADISNLRLRDHGLWIGKTIASYGASPMTIVPADLTVALERGTVDGGYTGWGFYYTFRLHESAPSISYTEIGKSAMAPCTINLDKWNSMTAEQQAIVEEAMALATEYGNEKLQENWESLVADVEAAGGSIYYLTKEENQAFVDAAAPLIEEAREATDDLGRELIDALLSAPSNYR
ncbi:MAG: TRAP transporter substrate-binding protein [Anaerovoracaceae bacterium]|jgi:TRAP-type C4-dicarboxylate transport system substrate-binding protein